MGAEEAEGRTYVAGHCVFVVVGGLGGVQLSEREVVMWIGIWI